MTLAQLECPFCGHPMTDHYLFAGRYEQPRSVVLQRGHQPEDLGCLRLLGCADNT